MKNSKTIAVIGPTASGKSDIAIALARQLNGVVIGADSRQVYRHMNLGSGKEPGKCTALPKNHLLKKYKSLANPYISDNIHHYMIDIVAPTTDYNCAKFTKKAGSIISTLHDKNILPIVCGGTHFWVQSLLEGTTFPTVAPNRQLRKKCEKKSTTQLLEILTKKDIRRATDIIKKNEQNNRIRIIRAIEIATTLGNVPQIKKIDYQKWNKKNYIIAIIPSVEQITRNITNRIQTRLDAGMLDEVHELHHTYHVPWTRLIHFGLEYKWCTLYIRNQCTMQEMKDGIIRESHQFAKRQITWIHRWEKSGAHIHCITTKKEALHHIQNFHN